MSVRRSVLAGAVAFAAVAGCGSTVSSTQSAGPAAPGYGLTGPANSGSQGLAGPSAAASAPITSDTAGGASVSVGSGSASTATASGPSGAVAGPGTVAAGVPGESCALGHPVRVGYTTFDTTGLGAAGASNPNNPLAGTTGSQAVAEDRRDMNALIAYANVTGGDHGCKIIGYPIQLSEADLPQSSRQAKCTQATEDDKVQAYIDNNGFFTEQDFACFVAHHVNYVGWADTTDRTFLRANAPYVTTTLASADRDAVALVQGLDRGKYFKGQTQVGVIIDDVPTLHKVYNDDMLPAFKAIGITPSAAFVSPLDESQQQAQSANAVLTFRTKGIDHVVFLANILVFESFSNEAQSQQWKPRYGLGDYQLLASGAAGFAQSSQLTNAMAVSNGPGNILDPSQVRSRSVTMDYGYKQRRDDSPGFQRCMQILSKQTHTDYHKGASGRSISFYTFCDHFLLWLQASRLAPDPTPQHFGIGLAKIGTSYESAAVHDTYFGPDAFDGASDYRVGLFVAENPACYCYRTVFPDWFPMPR